MVEILENCLREVSHSKCPQFYFLGTLYEDRDDIFKVIDTFSFPLMMFLIVYILVRLKHWKLH